MSSGRGCTVVDLNHAFDDVDKVAFGKGASRKFNINVDSAVELVTSNVTQVVSA